MNDENKNKVYIIPADQRPYPAGENPQPSDDELLSDYAQILYVPRAGEVVHVVYWIRYPEYDFIFGVPDPKNPCYGKEAAFYQFRDSRSPGNRGVYIDVQECADIVQGFTLLLEKSKTNSPHLWENRK